jgi:NAD(P)-dependent dehydrogenase (short-subunit alcohol dehydrogenase family)
MTTSKNRTAVVLGASEPNSMGGTIARRLIEGGANVVLAGRRQDKIKALGAGLGAEAVVCDITREQDVARLAKFAVTRFGRLDIAVNCAGEAIMGSIAETDEATLRRATDIHYIGPFFFIKHMAAVMEKGASIVTISSITATLTFHNHAAYMGAKAGTDHLVRAAALEYGPLGIKVNSISPGFTESPMTADFLKIPGVREAFEQEIPLGRLNTVDDIAAAVSWISSEEAFLTGQNVQVNGGNTLRRLPVIRLGASI